MDSLLYNAALRQKNELSSGVGDQWTPRCELEILRKSLDEPLVKVITGPRRCGKSTLVRQALKGKSYAYLNFEDEGIRPDVTGDEIMTVLDSIYGAPKYYFFDEIQNLPRWEAFLHRLHRESKNCVITGSNAHLLSSELASALTGRHRLIQLLPFSYAEFLQTRRSHTTEDFLAYLSSGGFPEVVLGKVQPEVYLGTLWDSVVFKDVVKRYRIRNIQALNDIYSLMLNAVTSKFNFDSLARAQGGTVSTPTIKNFVRYANEAYLLSSLEPFHFAARKRIKSDRKCYTFDNGFCAAKNIRYSQDKGKLLENAVYIELLRKGFIPNLSLFYVSTKSGYEIDFLLRRDAKNEELIQVSWTIESQKTREREIRAIIQAAKDLGITFARILTFDHHEMFQEGAVTIKVQPAHEWMLESSHS